MSPVIMSMIYSGGKNDRITLFCFDDIPPHDICLNQSIDLKVTSAVADTNFLSLSNAHNSDIYKCCICVSQKCVCYLIIVKRQEMSGGLPIMIPIQLL